MTEQTSSPFPSLLIPIIGLAGSAFGQSLAPSPMPTPRYASPFIVEDVSAQPIRIHETEAQSDWSTPDFIEHSVAPLDRAELETSGTADWLAEALRPPAWDEAFREFDQLKVMQDGWDGLNSRAATAAGVFHFESLLNELVKTFPDGPVPLVGLDCDGTFVLTYSRGGLMGSASLYEDGSFSFYIESGGRSWFGEADSLSGLPSDFYSAIFLGETLS